MTFLIYKQLLILNYYFKKNTKNMILFNKYKNNKYIFYLFIFFQKNKIAYLI